MSLDPKEMKERSVNPFEAAFPATWAGFPSLRPVAMVERKRVNCRCTHFQARESLAPRQERKEGLGAFPKMPCHKFSHFHV